VPDFERLTIRIEAQSDLSKQLAKDEKAARKFESNLGKTLGKLSDKKVSVQVEEDGAASTAAALSRVDEAADNVDGRTAKVNVEADTDKLQKLSGGFRGLASNIRATGTVLAASSIPFGIAAIGGGIPTVLALASSMGGLASGLGQAAAGFGLVGGAAAAGAKVGLTAYAKGMESTITASRDAYTALNAERMAMLEKKRQQILMTEESISFNRAIDGTITQFTRLQAEIGKGSFPIFTREIKAWNALLGELTPKIAQAFTNVSDIAGGFSRWFRTAEDGRVLGRTLDFILDSAVVGANILSSLGAAGVMAFQPLIPLARTLQGRVQGLAASINGWVQSAKGQQVLTQVFQRLADKMYYVMGIAVDLGQGLFHIFTALNRSGLTNQALTGLHDIAQGFDMITSEGTKTRSQIMGFLSQAKALMPSVGQAALALGRQFFRVASEVIGMRQEGHKLTVLQEIFRGIQQSARPLGNLLVSTFEALGPEIARLVPNLARMAELFAGSSGPLVLFVRTLNRAMEIFSRLPGPVKNAVVQIAAFKAITGGLGFGSLVSGVANLWVNYKLLGGQAELLKKKQFGVAAANLAAGGSASTAAGKFAILRGGLSRFGLLLAGGLGIVALAGAFLLAYNRSEKFKGAVDGLTSSLKTRLQGAADAVGNVIADIFDWPGATNSGKRAGGEFTKGVGLGLKNTVNPGLKYADATADAYGQVLGKRVPDATASAYRQAANQTQGGNALGGKYADATASAYGQQMNKRVPDATTSAYRQAAQQQKASGEGSAGFELGFQIAKTVIGGVQSGFKRQPDGSIKVNWGRIIQFHEAGDWGDKLRTFVRDIGDGIRASLNQQGLGKINWSKAINETFLGGVNVGPLVESIKKGLNVLPPWLKGAFAGYLKTALMGPWNFIYNWLLGKSKIPEIINGIKGWFEKLPGMLTAPLGSVKTKVSETWNNLWSSLRTRFDSFRSNLGGAISSWRDGVMGHFSGLKASIGQSWNSIWLSVGSRWNKFKSNMASGIQSWLGAAKGWFGSGFQAIGEEIMAKLSGAVNRVRHWLGSMLWGIGHVLKVIGADEMASAAHDRARELQEPIKLARGGILTGNEGAVGDGSRIVAITNETGRSNPEAVVPLKKRTPQGVRAAGAVANAYGLVPAAKQRQVDRRAHRHAPMRGMARGGVLRYQSGGIYPVSSSNVYPYVWDVAQAISSKYNFLNEPGTTYSGHGADGNAMNSIDFQVAPWGSVAQSGQVSLGNSIVSTLMGEFNALTDYIIWNKQANYGGGWEPYVGGGGYAPPSDPSGYHQDHVHWEGDNTGQGGISGGGGGVIGGVVSAITDTLGRAWDSAAALVGHYFNPPTLSDPGFGMLGKGMMSFAGTLITKAKDFLVSKATEMLGFGGSSGGAGGAALSGNPADNRALGEKMLASSTTAGSWGALDSLWTKESGWDHTAQNPSSSAFGIPQFLDATWAAYGGKSFDPEGQISKGLRYISDRYGSTDKAWGHSQDTGWYQRGGIIPGHAGQPVLIQAHSGERVLPRDTVESFDRLARSVEIWSRRDARGPGGVEDAGKGVREELRELRRDNAHYHRQMVSVMKALPPGIKNSVDHILANDPKTGKAVERGLGHRKKARRARGMASVGGL
jgi:phage-related protein